MSIAVELSDQLDVSPSGMIHTLQGPTEILYDRVECSTFSAKQGSIMWDIRSPSPGALMGDIRLVFPAQITPRVNCNDIERGVGDYNFLPRPDAILRAMSSLVITLNGTSQSFNPKQVLSTMHTLNSLRRDEDQARVPDGGFGEAPFGDVGQFENLEDHGEIWTDNRTKRKLLNFGPFIADTARDYEFLMRLPLAPFKTSFLMAKQGIYDGAVPYVNQLNIEMSFSPSALKSMFTCSPQFACLHKAALHTANVVVANAEMAYKDDSDDPLVNFHETPYALIDWVLADPRISGLAPAYQFQGYNFRVESKDIVFEADAVQTVNFSNIRVESQPTFIALICEVDTDRLQNDWSVGYRDWYCPVVNRTVSITSNTRSAILNNVDNRQLYEYFLQCADPNTRLSYEDWRDRKCVIALRSDILLGPGRNVFSPQTLAFEWQIQLPKFALDDYHAGGFTHGVPLRMQAKVIMCFDTALTVSENQMGISQPRISPQQFLSVATGAQKPEPTDSDVQNLTY